MRKFLFFAFVMSFSFTAFGQLESGTKLPGNIVAKDINGNNIDIFKDLDAGKSVVIDVFATWCGPCWSFHRAGVLKQLYNDFGPAGTDQIRVYAIEGDAATTATDLTTQGSRSQGNWVEGTTYPIIDDASFNMLLKINAFPTLYVIRPDRTLLNIGAYRYNIPAWEKALLPTKALDFIYVNSPVEKTFCVQAINNFKPKVLNLGTESIKTMTYTIKQNDNEKIVKSTREAAIFKEVELAFTNVTVNSNTEFIYTLEAINDIDVEVEDFEDIKFNYYRPIMNTNSLKVYFTTDFYPVETSFIVRDGSKTLLNHRFTGPADGGGPDANKTFEFDIELGENPGSCITYIINDSYGDGLTAFNSNFPTPGIEIRNANNDVIKPLLTADYNFTSSVTHASLVDLSSSLENEPFVDHVSITPNPVSDILNVDLKIKDGLDYELFISDIIGKSVTPVQKFDTSVDVSQLKSGIYFLNVKTERGLFTHKFVKL